jgi:hypothetical protein
MKFFPGPSYDVEKHFKLCDELHAQFPIRNKDTLNAHLIELLKPYHAKLTPALAQCIYELYRDDIQRAVPGAKVEFFLDDYQKRCVPQLVDIADRTVRKFLETFPHFPSGKEDGFAVSLAAYMPPRISTLFHALFLDVKCGDIQVFDSLARTLFDNLLRVSGYSRENYKGQKLFYPSDNPDPFAFMEYLRGTPFLDLLLSPVTFSIPVAAFREHGFLFAKSGHGKSQTLRAIFASLLDEDCALFLIDGNGAFIENVDKIAGIKDRLIILDPTEVPALNFYKLKGGSREKQMELFFYLFKAIDQGLTERQATMVAYLVDFMHAIPNSTLDTLRDVCEAQKELPYSQFLNDTPPITQDFFRRQFFSSDPLVRQTKSQIAQRLYTLCRNQAFINMFSAPENKFDAFEAMQEKKIVIVNTDRNLLGDHGSAIFGRFILAQCLAAAFQRPKDQRHLALIMCDESKAYLDDQSQKILSDARAFGLGLLLATQFPDQLQDGVRKEVINNTTIKFAGPMAYSVVAQVNRDMRCSADFILDMKKEDYSHAEWACYVDNLTPQAIKLTVPFGVLEKLPMLSDAEHARMRADNRKRYAARTPNPLPPAATPAPARPHIKWQTPE